MENLKNVLQGESKPEEKKNLVEEKKKLNLFHLGTHSSPSFQEPVKPQE